MPTDPACSRRHLLGRIAGVAGGLVFASSAGGGRWRRLRAETTAPAKPGRRFRIGACDWSIGRTGRVSALELAARIGLDGVQVSFGRPGAGDDLRASEARKKYREASRRHGVEIASLAMGVLNDVPYATSADAERWVQECIEVMPKLGVRRVLLAFFGRGDIRGKPELQKRVAQRLARVAPRAEKAGVVLGVESWLDAESHRRLLDAVGSPAVKVYYDVANMEKMGHDIHAEIRKLGRERICEIHCKENGSLLGQGRIDFRKVRESLDAIGYRGWLIIESATISSKTVFDCYVHNQEYLRRIFASAPREGAPASTGG